MSLSDMAGFFGAGAAAAPSGLAQSASGGMRMDWPAASRVEVSARLPSTRIWPVRSSFCR
ncbi:hypothetical protein [Azospirillum brasilense]|uniref:hypothetical protein n=1 Tax=Azospirillum brasilense TaxID=192 RepID=UPI001FE569E9|nr:hypothetical protein [Azospirillum brasilense]